MSDSRRFTLFAKVIKDNFPPERYPKVADIAGGKGYLQLALGSFGYNTTTFDLRKSFVKGLTYRHTLFDKEQKDCFSVLVGMHPDEATDVIITEAAKRKIPFVICPCCEKPTDSTFWGGSWVDHLVKYAKKLGFKVTINKLKMTGKNTVLIGTI